MSNRLVAQLGSVALLLLLAAVALFMTELYGPGVGTERKTAVLAVGGQVIVRNENARTLCLQGVGGQVFAGAYRDRMDQAVEIFEVEFVRYRRPTIEVSNGCPDPVAADVGERFRDPKTGKITALGPITETPSVYEIHLYIVAVDLYEEWFGDQRWAITAEEMWCGSPRTHTCAGATLGVYVTPSATADTIYRSVADAFGMSLPFDERPSPTPTE